MNPYLLIRVGSLASTLALLGACAVPIEPGFTGLEEDSGIAVTTQPVEALPCECADGGEGFAAAEWLVDEQAGQLRAYCPPGTTPRNGVTFLWQRREAP